MLLSRKCLHFYHALKMMGVTFIQIKFFINLWPSIVINKNDNISIVRDFRIL